MRERNGSASKRVTLRTAEAPARSPARSWSRPTPIGVTAPGPVMTTRRSAGMIGARGGRTGRGVRGDPPADTGQGAGRDAVNEHRADHEVCRRPPDGRPPGSIPFMDDGDDRAPCLAHDAPLHVHPAGDAPDVPVPDDV